MSDLESIQKGLRSGWGCAHNPVPDDGETVHEAWHAALRMRDRIAELEAVLKERARVSIVEADRIAELESQQRMGDLATQGYRDRIAELEAERDAFRDLVDQQAAALARFGDPTLPQRRIAELEVALDDRVAALNAVLDDRADDAKRLRKLEAEREALNAALSPQNDIALRWMARADAAEDRLRKLEAVVEAFGLWASDVSETRHLDAAIEALDALGEP